MVGELLGCPVEIPDFGQGYLRSVYLEAEMTQAFRDAVFAQALRTAPRTVPRRNKVTHPLLDVSTDGRISVDASSGADDIFFVGLFDEADNSVLESFTPRAWDEIKAALRKAAVIGYKLAEENDGRPH
jgi:hypothetical protein